MKSAVFFKLCIFLFSSFFFVSCGESEPSLNSAPPLRMVRTVVIQAPSDIDWRELPGEVDAAQRADIGFRVSGSLSSLGLPEGENVKTGQLLARLDDTDAKIQLTSRQAEYDQVHSDFRRGTALMEKGLISRSDFNKLEVQEAKASASLSVAKQNLEYTFLRAPFDGRIAKRHVDNYEEISAHQPVYTIQDLSSVKIKVSIPESVMIHIRKGDTPNLFAMFGSIEGKRFPLAVDEVSSQADEKTNTFEATLRMAAVEDYNILPGMSVTVRGERKLSVDGGAVYIPAQSVLEEGGDRFVYVVQQNGTDNNRRGVVEQRIVKTDELSSLGLKIVAGLNPGEEIVIAGMSKMHSGLEVRLAGE